LPHQAYEMVRRMQRLLQIIVWVFPVVIPGPG
jgi:hypothetical protein